MVNDIYLKNLARSQGFPHVFIFCPVFFELKKGIVKISASKLSKNFDKLNMAFALSDLRYEK